MPTRQRPGSSTAWRKLRAFVGARDGMRCQRPGCECGGAELTLATRQPTTLTLGHIRPWVETGHTSFDPADYRAECARGNYADGARIGNARRAARRGLNPSRQW
jgi:hypothetical protein